MSCVRAVVAAARGGAEVEEEEEGCAADGADGIAGALSGVVSDSEGTRG